MKDFIKIHRGNLELLSSGRFHLPPRLDRGMESPRLDRVLTYIDIHLYRYSLTENLLTIFEKLFFIN